MGIQYVGLNKNKTITKHDFEKFWLSISKYKITSLIIFINIVVNLVQN